MSFGIHLVGSASFADSTEAMKTFGAVLGPALTWMPDGEPDRPWMPWLAPIFAEHPQLEPSDEINDQSRYRPRRYRLKRDVDVAALRFDTLPHATVALRSYGIFKTLRAANMIPAACKFLFSIAAPTVPVKSYVVEAQQPLVERRYEEALAKEIEKITAAVPAGDIAIQWDCTQLVQIEQQQAYWKGTTREEILATVADDLVRIGAQVPRGVDLIYHMCYGDSGHRHFIEPASTANMVELANRIAAASTRNIELIHMPVPRDRADEAYFEPLRNLSLAPNTAVSLGLVHLTDGVAVSMRRIETARKYLSDFLIATECGLARRPREAMLPLLKIHADIAGL